MWRTNSIFRQQGLRTRLSQKKLAARDVDSAVTQTLIDFLEACDLFRFGNLTGNEHDRQKKYDEAAALIPKLEKALR